MRHPQLPPIRCWDLCPPEYCYIEQGLFTPKPDTNGEKRQSRKRNAVMRDSCIQGKCHNIRLHTRGICGEPPLTGFNSANLLWWQQLPPTSDVKGGIPRGLSPPPLPLLWLSRTRVGSYPGDRVKRNPCHPQLQLSLVGNKEGLILIQEEWSHSLPTKVPTYRHQSDNYRRWKGCPWLLKMRT